MICYSSDDDDIYADFERVYYTSRYVKPKRKKRTLNTLTMLVICRFMTKIVPDVDNNKTKQTDKSIAYR